MKRFLSILLIALQTLPLVAAKFRLPTPNTALFQSGAEDKYFVGTIGKPWTSGTFGCVRTSGWQMHEGLDIRSVQRDSRGEATDPIFATADGTVSYMNKKSGLSNYGIYLVLKHRIDGLEIYSTYAHLKEIRSDLKPGSVVKPGETIATMGRTTNTREGISKDRAHLHFELNLFVNDQFSVYYKKTFPGQRNDHAEWNGQNLIGLDPQAILLADRANEKFNLVTWIQSQTELFRVVVRKTDFPMLKRYPALVRRNPLTEKEGVAAYDIFVNFNGMPIQIIPRAESELKIKSKYWLVSVNAEEYKKNPCRKLVTNRNGKWELATNGTRLLDLLTY